jgi:hypothetical protein
MTEPLTARLCRCEQSLRTEDTCLRCGRMVPVPRDGEVESVGGSRGRSAWTRTGVVRAIRTFAFFRGRPPSRSDWKYIEAREGWPSLKVIEALFGSFPVAVNAAGPEGPAGERAAA